MVESGGVPQTVRHRPAAWALSPQGVLTVVVGEHQQPQPHQHLSQLIIAATVLPGSMRHKDEGPVGVRGSWVRRAVECLARLEQHGAFRTPAMSGD